MKRTWFLTLPLAALILTIVWAACTKSHSTENPGGPDGTGSNGTVTLITSMTWRYDTSGIDANKDGIVDVGNDSLFTPCTKDDIYTFKSDSTGILDEGATKCDTSDPQTLPFAWSLTNNNTVLTSTANPVLAAGVNIFSLSSTKWILYKDTTIAGFPIRYLLSLKH
jgi:hypothetical protein